MGLLLRELCWVGVHEYGLGQVLFLWYFGNFTMIPLVTMATHGTMIIIIGTHTISTSFTINFENMNHTTFSSLSVCYHHRIVCFCSYDNKHSNNNKDNHEHLMVKQMKIVITVLVAIIAIRGGKRQQQQEEEW